MTTMRPPLLPPPPIVIACVIWFLHGFGMLAYRTWLYYEIGCNSIIWELLYAGLFAPLFLGSVLTVTGVSDWRSAMIGLGCLIACIEIPIAFGNWWMDDAVRFKCTVCSFVSLLLATFLAARFHLEYLVWQQLWRRYVSASDL